MPSSPNVFTIFELVELVLSYILPSQPSQLYRLALINRTWFDVILPHLWKSTSLRQALSPLGEIRLVSKEYRFMQPENWDRFLMYSQHVKTLVGYDTDAGHLKAVAHSRSRPSTLHHLFPNNRSLTWRKWSMDVLTSDLTVLFSPSIENLTLLLYDANPSSFIPLCETLMTQLRTLKSLRLEVTQARPSFRECVISYQKLLKSFACTLTEVHMPEAFQTAEVVEVLSRISNLIEIAIHSPGPSSQTARLRSPISSPIDNRQFGKENPGSLQRLIYRGSQELLCNGYLKTFRVLDLVELNWHWCLKLEDPDAFIMILVSACPQLEKLTVGTSDMYRIKRRHHLPPAVTWETIQPLLHCQRLIALSLHCCRVIITPQDLFELFISRDLSRPWKVLEIFSAIPLSICIITVFAKYCPDLEYLGLHVFDCCTHDHSHLDYEALPYPWSELPPSSIQSSSPIKFLHLSTIDFAYSRNYSRQSSERIATILAEICDTQPSIAAWDPALRRDVPVLISQLHAEKRKKQE